MLKLPYSLFFPVFLKQILNPSKIDFNAVGEVTSLKPPAARMRYTRLRRQIESGTLIGTHGTPFIVTDGSKKRKKSLTQTTEGVKEGEEDEEDSVPKRKMVKSEGSIVKNEEDEYESDTSLESDEESEDEIPLAKLRKNKLTNEIGLASAVDYQDQDRVEENTTGLPSMSTFSLAQTKRAGEQQKAPLFSEAGNGPRWSSSDGTANHHGKWASSHIGYQEPSQFPSQSKMFNS